MAAPVRVAGAAPASGNFSSTTSPKASTGFDVQAGDLLVVVGSGENGMLTLGTPVASGGSVTWTLRQSISAGDQWSCAYIWTGVVGATASGVTVSVTRSGATSLQWGFTVSAWRGHGGVGTSGKANTTGAPSLALTCAANSAVVCGVNDWNAINGSSRVWRTVGAAPMTETAYYSNPGVTHTAYASYSPDVGAAGSKTLGLSAPTGQKYSIVGVEVLAGTDPGGTTYPASGTSAATSGISGTVARVARILAIAGTAAALSAASGDVARVPQARPVTGSAAAVSTASADVTRPTRTLDVVGTAEAASSASGAASVVAGAQTHPVGGTSTATSGVSGAVTARLVASGISDAVSGSSGDATRLPLLLPATGTSAATTAAGGSVSVLGGPQTYPVTGASTATSGSAGTLALLRAAIAATSAATSGASGDVAVLRAPVTWAVSSTATATSGSEGSTGLRALVAGTSPAASGAAGSVTSRSPDDGIPVPHPTLTLTSAAGTLTLDAPAATLTITSPEGRLTLT